MAITISSTNTKSNLTAAEKFCELIYLNTGSLSNKLTNVDVITNIHNVDFISQ